MRVITFGEAMLRFSPPTGSSLEKAEQYSVEPAGAEANVAVALARCDVDAAWVSRLPRNALGRRLAGRVRQHGVDVSRIVWSDEGRVGLYFVEGGIPPRPTQVIYDRADSAFSEFAPADLDLDMLTGADLIHLTGITPALSKSCCEVTTALVRAAVEREVHVSFDVNYRSKLWAAEDANSIFKEILPLVDLLFVSQADASVVLGLDATAEQQARELGQRFPRATVVVTAGEEGAWAWNGTLHHRPIIPGLEIDRIGRGDSFCAGYILGHYEGGAELGLAFGTALAALTQTYSGDITWVTGEDVRLVAGGSLPSHFR